MGKSGRKTIALVTLASSMVAAAPALSQEGVIFALEEIIVTSTRRAEGLQDIPIAVSVMNGEKILEQSITNLTELSAFTPNVYIAETTSTNSLFIRGVGSGSNVGFEQSVGTFIDGVYFGRGQSSRSAFLDVARVEVLKGPQSTLFGKNTIAGALNITSALPTDEFEGRINGTIEPEFGGWSTTGILSGPLTNRVKARLVVKRSETDGYVENQWLNQDERHGEDTIARLTLDWEATDDLSLRLKLEKGKSEQHGRASMVGIATERALGLFRRADPEFTAGFGYDKRAGNDPTRSESDFQDSEWDIASLTADWSIGEQSLRSVTSFVSYDFANMIDLDFSPLTLLSRTRDEEHEQFSQEFLLSSPKNGALEYLAGLYFQKEDLSSERVTDVQFWTIGLGRPGTGTSAIANLDQESETYSAFTQLTWNINDSFRLIGGLRFSDDSKELVKTLTARDLFSTIPSEAGAIAANIRGVGTDHTFDANGAERCFGNIDGNYECFSFPDFDNTRDEQHWTGDITLQWTANDDVMSYVKYNTGYKAGGFDEDNVNGLVDSEEFQDETVEGIEIGAKLDLWDGRARLNMAAFFNEFENVQISSFVGGSGFVVGNAAETESKGLEMDAEVLLAEGLNLRVALAYLDATYKSYSDAPCTAAQVVLYTGPRGGCIQDLSGASLQFAADLSGHIALTYERTLTDRLNLRLGADVIYSDDYAVANDGDSALIQDAYYKLNARIALVSSDEAWSLAILGKNLTNEEILTWGNDMPLGGVGFRGSYYQFIGAPRSVEVQASYNF